MAFKLKSQGAAFKMMGSSPMQKDGFRKGATKATTGGGNFLERKPTIPMEKHKGGDPNYKTKKAPKRKEPTLGPDKKPESVMETPVPVTKKPEKITKGDVIQTLVAPHADIKKTFNVTKHYTKQAVKGGKKVYRKVKNYLKSEA